jgi:DNA replication protein DnaC
MNSLSLDQKTYVDQILRKSGVPPRYLPHSFDNFEVNDKTGKAFEVAKEWAALKSPKDRGFALLGAPGVGKTHLAVAGLREIARLWADERKEEEAADLYVPPSDMIERRMRFINVPIFMDQLREAMKFSESSVRELWQYCLNDASVVVLDDFGKEKATDWVTERLYVLIESRYQNLLSTIVTTNRTLDELDDLGYGAAVSRLQETGRVVRTDAKDYRPELGVKNR